MSDQEREDPTEGICPWCNRPLAEGYIHEACAREEYRAFLEIID